MASGEFLFADRTGAHVEPKERTRRIVVEAPATGVCGRPAESEPKGLLEIVTGNERKWLIESVAETYVDEVPGSRHREVVAVGPGGQRSAACAGVALYTAEMTPNVESEPFEQHRERSVEVVAVSSSAARDVAERGAQIDGASFAEGDPHRVVGDPLDVRTVQGEERVDRRCRDLRPAEPGEIRVAEAGVERDAVLHAQPPSADFTASATGAGVCVPGATLTYVTTTSNRSPPATEPSKTTSKLRPPPAPDGAVDVDRVAEAQRLRAT